MKQVQSEFKWRSGSKATKQGTCFGGGCPPYCNLFCKAFWCSPRTHTRRHEQSGVLKAFGVVVGIYAFGAVEDLDVSMRRFSVWQLTTKILGGLIRALLQTLPFWRQAVLGYLSSLKGFWILYAKSLGRFESLSHNLFLKVDVFCHGLKINLTENTSKETTFWKFFSALEAELKAVAQLLIFKLVRFPDANAFIPYNGNYCEVADCVLSIAAKEKVAFLSKQKGVLP